MKGGERDGRVRDYSRNLFEICIESRDNGQNVASFADLVWKANFWLVLYISFNNPHDMECRGSWYESAFSQQQQALFDVGKKMMYPYLKGLRVCFALHLTSSSHHGMMLTYGWRLGLTWCVSRPNCLKKQHSYRMHRKKLQMCWLKVSYFALAYPFAEI